MGREIVYCEGCKISLREVDFERGKAQEIDNRPWCATCKPLPPPSKSSSPRVHAIPNKSSTARLPAATPRRPVPAAQQK
ncbi:MAG: hypothetical protein AAB322_07110, partial [Pseudomonadota bacterium]